MTKQTPLGVVTCSPNPLLPPFVHRKLYRLAISHEPKSPPLHVSTIESHVRIGMTRRAASSIFLIGGEAQALPRKGHSTICSINQIPPSTHIVMDGSADSIAEETLFALETRLRRIEFVLAGSREDPVGELYALRKSGKESSVKSRLNGLERDLSRLAIKSRTVKDMLDLRLYPPTHSQTLVRLP